MMTNIILYQYSMYKAFTYSWFYLFYHKLEICLNNKTIVAQVLRPVPLLS